MRLLLSHEELVLLYLYDKLQLQREGESLGNYPKQLSAEGIVEGIGLAPQIIYRAAKNLKKKGQLEIIRQFVTETGRHRNFYVLTLEGKVRGKGIQEGFAKRKITLGTDSGNEELSAGEIVSRFANEGAGIDLSEEDLLNLIKKQLANGNNNSL